VLIALAQEVRVIREDSRLAGAEPRVEELDIHSY